MIGLILKDIYNLKKHAKQYMLMLVVFGLFAFNFKNPSYLIGMIAMMASMLVITSMSYDEYARWDKYALTMPILKKDIVLAKYILLVISLLSGTVLSGAISLVMAMSMKLQDPKETLLTCGIVALVVLLLFCILIPILFKFGVEKARIIMFAVFIIPTFTVAGVIKLMEKLNIPKPGVEQIRMLGYAFPVVVLMVLFLSYNISVSIYNKKEL